MSKASNQMEAEYCSQLGQLSSGLSIVCLSIVLWHLTYAQILS